jgi:hypothetical protein
MGEEEIAFACEMVQFAVLIMPGQELTLQNNCHLNYLL